MNFLIDNQLPIALSRFLAARGHNAVHVLEVALAEARDEEIWAYASTRKMALISKDEDFLRYAIGAEGAATLIWVRLRNCRNSSLLAAFDKSLQQIVEALESGQSVVEIR